VAATIVEYKVESVNSDTGQSDQVPFYLLHHIQFELENPAVYASLSITSA